MIGDEQVEPRVAVGVHRRDRQRLGDRPARVGIDVAQARAAGHLGETAAAEVAVHRREGADEAGRRAVGTADVRDGEGLAERDLAKLSWGDLGVDILRAVKATLDPAGILNPGKLIP